MRAEVKERLDYENLIRTDFQNMEIETNAFSVEGELITMTLRGIKLTH